MAISGCYKDVPNNYRLLPSMAILACVTGQPIPWLLQIICLPLCLAYTFQNACQVLYRLLIYMSLVLFEEC